MSEPSQFGLSRMYAITRSLIELLDQPTLVDKLLEPLEQVVWCQRPDMVQLHTARRRRDAPSNSNFVSLSGSIRFRAALRTFVRA
jgi:hypothetical protein